MRETQNMKRLLTALALMSCLQWTPAAAQDWPTRSVTMMVAGAAGSAPDVTARVIADKLSAAWGKPVIVENKPGAAGVIGTDAAAKAAPDGYTLLFAQAAPLTLTKFTHVKMPYDVERDFAPISMVGISPMIIAVAPQLNVTSLDAFLKLAKEQPGKLSYTTSSSRNVPHLTGELFKSLAGIDVVHVPSRNSQTALADVISGRVAMMVDGVPVLAPFVTDGRLKAIAITSASRMAKFENIPTLSETFPGAEVNGWFAMVAPAKTPPEVIARVNRDLRVILKDETIVARFQQTGLFADGGTPENLRDYIQADLKRWQRAVEAAKLQKE
jgi:tripartite-type tricarboxylate transporter receptor subunit TctC